MAEIETKHHLPDEWGCYQTLWHQQVSTLAPGIRFLPSVFGQVGRLLRFEGQCKMSRKEQKFSHLWAADPRIGDRKNLGQSMYLLPQSRGQEHEGKFSHLEILGTERTPLHASECISSLDSHRNPRE